MGVRGRGSGGDRRAVKLLRSMMVQHTDYPHSKPVRARWFFGLMAGRGRQALEAGVALSHPGALPQ